MTRTIASVKIPRNLRVSLMGWALALGVLAYLAAHGQLVGVDHGAADWVAALRTPSLDGPMRALTWFGGSTWTILSLGGLGLWAWRRRGLRSALFLAVMFGIGALLEVITRFSVAQWRPDTLTIPPAMDLWTRFELAGFPSGHAFRSALVFGWLSRELGGSPLARVGRLFCLLMIGAVGFTRLYLNRHWASDVVGSWLVVLAVLALADVWQQKS